MINLLPPRDYRQLHAKRHNVLLIRLLITVVICLLGTMAVVASAYALISMQESAAITAKHNSEQSLGKYRNVEQETKSFQSNLATAKQMLDKNISYRTMIINIGQVLPKQSIISSLELTPETVGVPTTITIKTTSYEEAVRIKDLLNKSAIATDVSLGGVSNSASEGAAGQEGPAEKYPVSAQVNLTFTKSLLTPTWETADDGGKK